MVMNALFGAAIKVFLALLQAQDAVGQDHRDGADGRDGWRRAEVSIGGHEGLYRPGPGFFSGRALAHADQGIAPSQSEIRQRMHYRFEY